MKMTVKQQAQVISKVLAIEDELREGYDYTTLPDPNQEHTATAEDVIENLTAALYALQRQPGRT